MVLYIDPDSTFARRIYLTLPFWSFVKERPYLLMRLNQNPCFCVNAHIYTVNEHVMCKYTCKCTEQLISTQKCY